MAEISSKRLELPQKLLQKSLMLPVLEVAKGKPLRGPIVVDLDPTSFCDLACPECISTNLLQQQKFSKERLLELAREMIDLGVRAVILIGGGEPLLHSGTREIIRTLGQNSLSVGIVTNGTQIDRNLDVLSTYVKWTRVSVDAASPESYEIFRPSRNGKNQFHKVIANMKGLAETKTGDLGYSFLLLSREDQHRKEFVTNYGEVFKAGLLAKNIGCDYFELKHSFNMQHFLVKQPQYLVEILKEQIEQLRALETDTFKVIYSKNMEILLHRGENIEHKSYERCLISELRTLITPSGAYICSYHRGNKARQYGDPSTTSLQEMWSSFNRGYVMEDTNPSLHCSFHCARHGSNLLLYELGLEENVSSESFVDDYDLFI